MELKIKTIKLENDKITKDAESLEHKIEEIKQSMINHEINKTTQKQHDREYYIHNQARFKNGLAMLKLEENKFIRVLVIPKYKYNKYSRKWIPKYFVRSMTECITVEEFINKNSNFIIRGRENIIKAKRIHDQIKKENMKAYRIKLRAPLGLRNTDLNI